MKLNKIFIVLLLFLYCIDLFSIKIINNSGKNIWIKKLGLNNYVEVKDGQCINIERYDLYILSDKFIITLDPGTKDNICSIDLPSNAEVLTITYEKNKFDSVIETKVFNQDEENFHSMIKTKSFFSCKTIVIGIIVLCSVYVFCKKYIKKINNNM